MTVREIYDGSNGEATTGLYDRLAALGPAGALALNIFRATKCSARAKHYRGGNQHGSYRKQAYRRKEYSLSQLTAILSKHSGLSTVWGWQPDPATPGYPWVLYVELPTGQGSWHTATRGVGPDYPGVWDGVKDATADRIITWCEQLLDGHTPAEFHPPVEMSPPGENLTADFCPVCAVWWPADRGAYCPRGCGRLQVKARPTPVAELRPGVRAEWA